MSDIPEMILNGWKVHLDQEQADLAWQEKDRELTQGRRAVCPPLLKLLNSFLEGSVGVEEFRAIFDKKTRTEWNHFGLKGLSGAMFLNMLVKYLPDQAELETQLRAVLPEPGSPEQAEQRLRAFYSFLKQAIGSGIVTGQQIHPARSLFFVSAWWHLQALEEWPVYYVSARRVMQSEGAYTPATDPVDDYFLFRKRYLTLAEALGLDIWSLEWLCLWLDGGKGQVAEVTDPAGTPTSVIGTTTTTAAIAKPQDPIPEEMTDEQMESTHAKVQWMLAKLGKKLGCNVWIARNDHGKTWDGERLGDMSLPSLPTLGLDKRSQEQIALIDVVWLRGTHQVAAAFEVEHTTSIFSGILRMADLTVLSPNLNFSLYIIAPQHRLDLVRKQLARPTFQFLELHKRCGYVAAEGLSAEFDSMMKWSNSPAAIEQLASRVDDGVSV